MKLLYILLLICFVYPATAQDFATLDDFEKVMKPGTILTYDVTEDGKQYQWKVKLVKVGNELSYTWETTTPSLQKGTTSVTANGMANADALSKLLATGTATLDKEVALLISKKMFDEVSTTSQLSLRVNGAADAATVFSNTIAELSFTINDKPAGIQGWELEDNEKKYKLSVIESYKYPLIYSLDAGVSLRLVSIQTQ